MVAILKGLLGRIGLVVLGLALIYLTWPVKNWAWGVYADSAGKTLLEASYADRQIASYGPIYAAMPLVPLVLGIYCLYAVFRRPKRQRRFGEPEKSDGSHTLITRI